MALRLSFDMANGNRLPILITGCVWLCVWAEIVSQMDSQSGDSGTQKLGLAELRDDWTLKK